MSVLSAAGILAGFWALCALGTWALRRLLDRHS